MGAVPADVVAGLRAARIISREDADVLADAPGARDQLTNPAPGFFDNAADAQAALAIKAALIGQTRRRFAVPVSGLIGIDPANGVPTATLTDAALDFSGPAMVARAEEDLENDRTVLELIG